MCTTFNRKLLGGKSEITDSNRSKLIKSYIQGKPISEGYPIALNIEATNYCNLNCIMCPRDKMKRKIGMMECGLFKKIINESRDYVDFVWLHLFGESLFHKDIFKMIAFAVKADIKVGLSTNATLLSKKNICDLLKSNLNILIISLDNPSKTTYQKVRKGGDYEQVEKNVIFFLNQLKNVENKPIVILQMIDLDICPIKEQIAFKNKYTEYSNKYSNIYIKIKDFCNWGGQDDAINQLSNERDFKIPVSNLKCFEPWRALTIYCDGTVVPCCFDFDGSYILGDVKHDTIKSIWNGVKIQELRKSFQIGKSRINLCEFCPSSVLTYEECCKSSSPFHPFAHEIEYYCKKKDILDDHIIMGVNDMGNLGKGWYHLENWPPAIKIRWTSKKAVAYLKNDTKGIILKMKFFTNADLEVNVFVNNSLIKKEKSEKDIWQILEGEIDGDERLLEVKIELNKTWIPDEIFHNGDKRELGIAVEKIWIE
jgi:MoaA/NifB/PqqE/SkfB family radical SAM enzyme